MADLEDYEELKSEVRAIKEDAIGRLPEMIDELAATVEANSVTVYLADDANRYVREVAREQDADRLVKSKAMTSEELEVNEVLAADDVDVVDLSTVDLAAYADQLYESRR